MMREAALLLLAAAAASAQPGARSHGTSSQLDAAVPPPSKPESSWLTMGRLKEIFNQLDYTTMEQDGRLIVTLTPEDPKRIYAEFSDQDSLKLLASWNSPQKDLGDGPIVNTWNNERRFCKVSINENPEDDKTTLMVMHMDQLLYTDLGAGDAGQKAVRAQVSKAMELFKAGVVEFDHFVRETYLSWQKQWKAEGKEL